MSSGSLQCGRPKFPSGIVFGLVFVCFGLALLMDNLEFYDALNVLKFWPCALGALGLVRLWNKGLLNIWGQILVVAGILLQIASLGGEEAVELWWPILIVWVGLIVIAKAFIPKKERMAAHTESSNIHEWKNDDIEVSVVAEIDNNEE